MGICINPDCLTPNYPHDPAHRYCQSCGSDLLLVGRYRVTSLLSDNSGFGTIYEADEQNIPKILKVLKKQLNHQPKAVELFQQEVEVLQQLDHPGIPKVDGYFQYQTKHNLSLHCFVMEKIDGLNLEQWLELRLNQPIDEKTAIKWLKQVTEILDKVHQKDYFHRDIKPSNIMVRGNGQLVLIDFGTAREITGTYLAKVSRKKEEVTGIITPGYTPLEQANGQALPQSDFFALGRTFVYLVTGESPNFMKINPYTGELIWQDQTKHISPQLIDLINYLIAPFPGQRPKNAQEILSRLTEIEQKNKTLYQSQNLSSKKINLSQKHKNIQHQAVSPTLIQGKKPTHVSRNSLSIFWISSYFWIKLIEVLLSALIAMLLVGSIIFISIRGHEIDIDNRLVPIKHVDPSQVPVYPYNHRNKYLIKQINVPYQVYSLVISPDIKTLVSSHPERVIMWDINTGMILNQIQVTWESITPKKYSNSDISIAISRDSKTVVCSCVDHTIKVWNLVTGELIKSFPGGDNTLINVLSDININKFALSPDNETLALGTLGKIKIWDLNAGKLLKTLNDSPSSLVISPDGKLLISGGNDGKIGKIKIWNLATGNLLNTLYDNYNSWVGALAITPDGKTLVSSGSKGIKLWDLATGKLLNTLDYRGGYITAIAISSDGQKIVSGGDIDKAIKVWDLTTGKLLYSLEGNEWHTLSVAIARDGKTIVSSDSIHINIWRLP